MLSHIRGFMALLSFLTIIPTRTHDVVLASKYFFLVPFVGFVEGIIVITPILIPVPVALKALFVLLVFYVLTGFNHIDGFADFADAIASRKRGEEALKIMKEPWRGAMSVAATIILVLSTYISLYFLVDANWTTIVLAQVLGFESMFLLATISSPPSYSGLGEMFVSNAKDVWGRTVNIVVTITIVLLVFLHSTSTRMTISLFFMTLTTLFSTIYVYFKAHGILGYSNGDVLGFCLEVTRTSNLLVSSIVFSLSL